MLDLAHRPAAGAVALGTSAAPAVSPVSAHRTTTLLAAMLRTISHIHIALPEPRPACPRREGNYFEAARMSRHMDRL